MKRLILSYVLIVVCSFAKGAALFNIQTIITNDNSYEFLAHADNDGIADVFILNGNSLTAYASANENKPSVINLVEGTSAFDVADIDEDNQNEIIAVRGNRILRHIISQNGDGPEELFQLETQLADTSGTPFTRVLSVKYGDRTLLALPCKSDLQLRTYDGELVESFPSRSIAAERLHKEKDSCHHY